MSTSATNIPPEKKTYECARLLDEKLHYHRRSYDYRNAALAAIRKEHPKARVLFVDHTREDATIEESVKADRWIKGQNDTGDLIRGNIRGAITPAKILETVADFAASMEAQFVIGPPGLLEASIVEEQAELKEKLAGLRAQKEQLDARVAELANEQARLFPRFEVAYRHMDGPVTAWQAKYPSREAALAAIIKTQSQPDARVIFVDHTDPARKIERTYADGQSRWDETGNLTGDFHGENALADATRGIGTDFIIGPVGMLDHYQVYNAPSKLSAYLPEQTTEKATASAQSQQAVYIATTMKSAAENAVLDQDALGSPDRERLDAAARRRIGAAVAAGWTRIMFIPAIGHWCGRPPGKRWADRLPPFEHKEFEYADCRTGIPRYDARKFTSQEEVTQHLQEQFPGAWVMCIDHGDHARAVTWSRPGAAPDSQEEWREQIFAVQTAGCPEEAILHLSFLASTTGMDFIVGPAGLGEVERAIARVGETVSEAYLPGELSEAASDEAKL